MADLPEFIHYTTITDIDGMSLGFAPEELGEFDFEVDLIEFDNVLRSLGVEPYRLKFGHDLVKDLIEKIPTLLWNMNSGVLGPTREAQVPALCEMLGIPIVGSNSWTAFITQDKTLTSDWLLRNHVPIEITDSVTISSEGEISKLETLNYPGAYIVKPNNEGSSRGLDSGAVQYTCEGLRCQTLRVTSEWGAVRVEKYVKGFDISANLACLSDGTLFPLEPVMIETVEGIYTGAMKNSLPEAPHTKRWPLKDYDVSMSKDVQDLALRIGSCLRFRHYARLDLRLEQKTGKLYFLEANLCPSFSLLDDYLLAASLSGLTFQELVSNILAAAYADAKTLAHFRETPAKIRSHVLSRNSRISKG